MKLYRREQYLSKIRGFYHDTDIIKVITGVRRCGKSSLMEMIKEELIEGGVSKEQIIYLDLDSRKYRKNPNKAPYTQADLFVRNQYA